MLKIKRFLGYTDGIKEPRKTKVENELSRCYRYKGSIRKLMNVLIMIIKTQIMEVNFYDMCRI